MGVIPAVLALRGRPIPEPLAREFAGLLVNGHLVPLYGASEVMAATCCHHDDSLQRMSSSDGSPALDSLQIKIIGPDSGEATPGEEGGVCYRGPGAILGTGASPNAAPR